jgi:hypothetical protein
VRYNDRAPWPPAADGTGPALARRSADLYGNDPAHWLAELPTPGRLNAATDGDQDGTPDLWESASGTDPDSPDSDADPDGDTLSNRQEYLAGTDPLSSSSRLRLGLTLVPNEPGTVLLSFQASSNRVYWVQVTDNLRPEGWSTAAVVPARATNGTAEVRHQSSQGTRFYRLLLP